MAASASPSPGEESVPFELSSAVLLALASAAKANPKGSISRSGVRGRTSTSDEAADA